MLDPDVRFLRIAGFGVWERVPRGIAFPGIAYRLEHNAGADYVRCVPLNTDCLALSSNS